MKKEAKILISVSFFIFVMLLFLFVIFFMNYALAENSASSGNASLTIWDNALPDGSIKLSNMNVSFYANYTNSTAKAINATNGNGTCQTQFNFTGSYTDYVNMTFNSISLLWGYNRSFNYKGAHQFQVNCTSSFGNVSVIDSFQIDNTAPAITYTLGGTYIDFDGDTATYDYWQCTEDSLCTYNFSANVTEPDVNDVLTFNYSQTTNTTLTNFTVDNSTGVLTINITNNANTGNKQVELTVKDTESATKTGILRVNITASNDAPYFVNLVNQTLNMSELFRYIINATDEENNIPYTFNITFLNCTVAQWSTRNCSNSSGRELFNSSQYTTNGTSKIINISFTPTKNDVGFYIINFTVTDLNNNATPYNASTSVIVNFTVLNANSMPYFRYVCNNERNATEDSLFNCLINATDIDEINNLTFVANYTWFAFNVSGTNATTIATNITTNFNATAIVNFTVRDAQVGNWSVNVTVTDTGSPSKSNSTIFYFFIANVNDSVTLDAIPNKTAYTTNNYTIYVNASDDDLLIPDKSVYNESLTFSSNNSNVSVSVYSVIAGTNKTQAVISFNPNNLGAGNHTINISVNDANNFSRDSKFFVISVVTNNPPQWNSSLITNYSLTEDTNFYLNLSGNVSDAENNLINFTFVNDTSFPSFSLNLTTGIINFTPNDTDIGFHVVTISAFDGVTSTPLAFNFTVTNINDTPVIQSIGVAAGDPSPIYNASGNNTAGITINEDNHSRITVWAHDDDYRIPNNQKSYYNESVTLNVTIQGPNTRLFNFTKTNNFPSGSVPQRVEFISSIFSPNKSDVGNYNITLNASDASGLSNIMMFNLTVTAINHAPNITQAGNIISSIIESIYIKFNVTDTEEINETTLGSNLTFSIKNLTVRGNFLTINSTNGVINFTFNQSIAGTWAYNVSVNDSSGETASSLFNITVYDYPTILSPSASLQFNLKENVSSQLNFSVNHTVQDTLNYTLIIRGVVRNSTTGYGNGTSFLWNFTANFTDETTCSGVINLTLNVSNSKLSNSTTWNLTINHTNSPLVFSGTISNQSGGSPVTLTLSNYFTDADASDSCVNQTVGFSPVFVNRTALTISITNWTNTTTPSISFSSSSSTNADYNIIAFEYNGSAYNSGILSNSSSNNFNVQINVTTITTTTTTSGGGGGSTTTKTLQKLISLKIIVPEGVSARKKDKLVIPISVENDGEINLTGIVLEGTIAKNGILRKDLIASFDRSLLSSLAPGAKENVTLIIDIDTNATGLFEVTINGTVKSPPYRDWGKFFIEIKENDTVREKILFTEEFIVGNPECVELKEIVDEAKKLFEKGDLEGARKKSDEALDGCKKAISQPISARVYARLRENVINYVSILTLSAIVLGTLYYYYKRRKFARAMMGY